MLHAAATLVALGVLVTAGCGPVQMDCDVCGKPETFLTCQDLYCRYLASSKQCAAVDLNQCYTDNACPSPYFLFCPADTRTE